jgi:hypothetical protein
MSRGTRTLNNVDRQQATLVHLWRHHLDVPWLRGIARRFGRGRTVGLALMGSSHSLGSLTKRVSFEVA